MTITKSFSKLLTVHLLLLSAFLYSCNGGSENSAAKNDMDTLASTPNAMETSGVKAEALLTGTYTDTTLTGSAVFEETGGKVKLTLKIEAPAKANKEVAVHIHEHGACGDMGKEAHGHWNPTNQQHGKWGSESFHLGDIGNVKLDGEGNGTLEMETNLWSIGGDSTSNILDRAIIVHGGVDDYVSQPTGDAGNRIGCGVIKKM